MALGLRRDIVSAASLGPGGVTISNSTSVIHPALIHPDLIQRHRTHCPRAAGVLLPRVSPRAREVAVSVLEPGGCTASRSDSNSNVLTHPARAAGKSGRAALT